ncbi:MAG: hypothetical protein CVV33_07310 [Methanomicrobiales archaeon HGW-Methanomicrobiales-4]|nr:MAG: hypothetical protein CVV33_07310 [Methanomicrobiales archaeon HGW-Methanomicrobiales-4]
MCSEIILFICLVSALVASSASAYTTDFPKSYSLWEGTAAMHEIGVYGSCGTQVTVKSPDGAAFDIYAMKNHGSPGTCPSNAYIMTHNDLFAYSDGGMASLYLSEGLWCVVVNARSGSGAAYVTADSNCFHPGPIPPVVPPYPCSPYKTVDRSGYLYQGQAAVYGYYIPADGRSQIEWMVTGTGYCGDTPIIMSSVSDQMFSTSSPFTGSNCGKFFDMYVFKDCNPQYSYCSTNYYVNGPSSYASVANPPSGSTYYVMVYARTDGGTYNLRMNSYTCVQDTPIIIAAALRNTISDGTGYSWGGAALRADTAGRRSVPASPAEFVPVSSE